MMAVMVEIEAEIRAASKQGGERQRQACQQQRRCRDKAPDTQLLLQAGSISWAGVAATSPRPLLPTRADPTTLAAPQPAAGPG